MVEFKTLAWTQISLDRGFLVIATKRAISERTTEFISISKADANKKFKQTLTIPRKAEIVEEIAEALKSVLNDESQDAFTDPTTEEVDEETARALGVV